MMYRTTLEKTFDTKVTNHIPSVQTFARRFSVEDIITNTSSGKTNSQTNSFVVLDAEAKSPLEQASQVIPKDSCFTSIDNELGFSPDQGEDNKRYYSTRAPYTPPPQDYILSSPPAGYKPVCVQHLSRHGSRTLTEQNYGLQTLEIWQLAKEKNMLTSFGEDLKKDTELFMEANNQVGIGELTQLGRDEQVALGTRLFHRMKSLFIPSNTVTVVTTERKRVIESAHEFLNGLTKCQSDIQISFEKPNTKLLYFHKSCTEYITFIKSDTRLKTVLNTIKHLEQTKTYARQVLTRIYKEEFVELLINGNYKTQSSENIDPIAIQTTKNDVDIVICLYSMFSVVLTQSDPHVTKMLAKYFSREESNWFAYMNDAQEFYVKGPSFVGTTITYDMAKPLLANFFSSIDTCLEQPNNNLAAYLRFAHAETVIPFATLLNIPDCTDKAADFTDIYTYENNPWRGEKVSPMAVNVQWEVYRHEDNHDQILVRMLYNEREVRFKHDCQSITPGSFFYDYNELKRSYANVLLPSTSEMN